MSQFYVSVPEEFVSDSSLLPSVDGETLAQHESDSGVSHHVAVLANSMLSELQRLASVYGIDPSEMSSLAKLITSSLEELDISVTEHAAAEAATNQVKLDLEQVLKKLSVEQDLRQASERRLWEVQDFAESEHRQVSGELQQMKAANTQLTERWKSKSNNVQALQDELEEVRRRQAEERQNHLETIKRYMQEKDHHSESLERSMTMGNTAVFAPTGTFRRRSSIRSRSKRASTTSPFSVTSPELTTPPPPGLPEETLIPASESSQAGAEELQRLCRSETLSHSSAEWEATMGFTKDSTSDMSLLSELNLSDVSQPAAAAHEATCALSNSDTQGLLSDEDVDTVLEEVEQLAKDAAAVDVERAQLAKENTKLKGVVEDLKNSEEEYQRRIALLQTTKDHLELDGRNLRADTSRMKDLLAQAARASAVPDFSIQLRKENERLMKLYSFYKEKCQTLQEESSKQAEPMDAHGGLRGLFARLLSGLRRRKDERSQGPHGVGTASPGTASPSPPTSGNISPDSMPSGVHSSTVKARDSPKSGRKAEGAKRASLQSSTLPNKMKTMSIAYRPRQHSSSEVSISFDKQDGPVVTTTGIFSPCGDWIVGHQTHRAVGNEDARLASCCSQAALFSAESSKIVCTTISTCLGSSALLDPPLIDFSSTADDSGSFSDGPVCQQLWICTKQLGSVCKVEILDIIGSGNLRHSGTIKELDTCTRNDTILCMEFMPDVDPASFASASDSPRFSRSSSNASACRSISTVWMGTDSADGHVLMYDAKPGKHLGEKVQECHFGHGAVTCIRYAFQRAFVGFSNGLVLGFDREAGSQCGWHTVASDESTLKLANLSAPSGSRQLNSITCMQAVETVLWCACGNYLFAVEPNTLTVVSCAKTIARHPIGHMISLGCAVVLATAHSSKLLFHHPASAKLIQDFETSALQAVVDAGESQSVSGRLNAITSLAFCESSLWVGTGTGVLLRLPVKTVLDTDSLQMALASPACSHDTACVAQWSHWSAVRCLQVLCCSQHHQGAGSMPPSQSWVVFSGGLGSIDYRSASASERESKSQYSSSLATATRSRVRSVSGNTQLQLTAPMFQQILVWKS